MVQIERLLLRQTTQLKKAMQPTPLGLLENLTLHVSSSPARVGLVISHVFHHTN